MCHKTPLFQPHFFPTFTLSSLLPRCMEGPALTVKKRHANKRRKHLQRKLKTESPEKRLKYQQEYRRSVKVQLNLLKDEVTRVSSQLHKLSKQNKGLQRKLEVINQNKLEKSSLEDTAHTGEVEEIHPLLNYSSTENIETRKRWILDCKQWIQKQQLLHAQHLHYLVNLSENDYNRLWKKVKPLLKELNMEGELRVYKTSQTMFFTNEEQFFLAMVWLHTFLTWSQFGLIVGFLDGRYLAKCVHRVLCAMSKLYSQLIFIPSDTKIERLLEDKWPTYFTNGHEAWSRMAFVVDGSSFDVPKPSASDVPKSILKTMKPPHKKRFVANALFLVRLDGKFVACSDVKPGSHDQLDWIESGWRVQFLRKTYGVGGDGMFSFNPENELEKIIGFNPPRLRPGQDKLSDSQLVNYTRFSQLRVVVENAISRVKSWGCLKQRFRYYSICRKEVCSLNLCLRACVVAEQVKMKTHPLRPPGWTPDEVYLVHEEGKKGGEKKRKVAFRNNSLESSPSSLILWD